MGEMPFLYRILRIAMRETTAGSSRAEAIIKWLNEHRGILAEYGLAAALAPLPADEGDARWQRLEAAVAAAETAAAVCDSDELEPMVIAGRVAALMALPNDDARLLSTLACLERTRHSSDFWGALCRHVDRTEFIARISGIEGRRRVLTSQAIRLGLIERTWAKGETDFVLTSLMDRVLDALPVTDEEVLDALVGKRVSTPLTLADFAGHRREVDFMRRLLTGALQAGGTGVNILLYGPPGTGKTELAKALAAAAGADALALGEGDAWGNEPNRGERLAALHLAQRALAARRDAVLLFDEMEDVTDDGVVHVPGGGPVRPGSKVFLNRLFEINAIPVIWTSNTINNVDPAFLRRMSFVLKMDLPPLGERRRIIGRIAEAEGMALSDAAVGRLADIAPEATTVTRIAIRSARFAGGGEAEAGQVIAALVSGVRQGQPVLPVAGEGRPLDLDLCHACQPIGDLMARLTRPGMPLDFSILLSGPPGTGKTALARHLAQALDLPIVIKRASDLLSKWIGATERNIAGAFAEAAAQRHVLLFDEVDSFLFDRQRASKSWEVTQVNELLTWMENHPLPFIAATNHVTMLDPAAMRRFTFKLTLEALPAAKAAHAFQVFFDRPAPDTLAAIDGLTPGDFAVVARQLRFADRRPTNDDLVDLLAAEAAAKPHRSGPVGFRPVKRLPERASLPSAAEAAVAE